MEKDDISMTSYVCFDLETTGLSPDKDEIIEIGAVKVIEGKVVDRFMRLVKPDQRISETVLKLPGLPMKWWLQPDLQIESFLIFFSFVRTIRYSDII